MKKKTFYIFIAIGIISGFLTAVILTHLGADGYYVGALPQFVFYSVAYIPVHKYLNSN